MFHFRKIVSGGLNFSIIKSFIQIFFEEANDLAEILQMNCNLKTNDCNISNFVSLATMEMIGRSSLGVTFNAQKGGRNRFIENLQTAMHVRCISYYLNISTSNRIIFFHTYYSEVIGRLF